MHIPDPKSQRARLCWCHCPPARQAKKSGGQGLSARPCECGGGVCCIKDNIEAGANSRAHHSLGRGLVPRKQRTPTRAPAPTAGRLASQLPAGHVGSSAGSSSLAEQQRHRPEADPWCPPASGRAERAGEGGSHTSMATSSPAKKSKNQGHRGRLCPSSPIARKRRFLTRVLSQPTWHLASHLRIIEHNEHDAPEAQPPAAVSTLSSTHDGMNREGGRCG